VPDPKVKNVPSPHHQQTERPHYTQVNILFPSEQVELPSADKFKAFPAEAQKAILTAFEREQIERHLWLKNQQANEHTLNMQNGATISVGG
jgi:TRAP-type C4-dicarboxylate transport system substrate-binding protein